MDGWINLRVDIHSNSLAVIYGRSKENYEGLYAMRCRLRSGRFLLLMGLKSATPESEVESAND